MFSPLIAGLIIVYIIVEFAATVVFTLKTTVDTLELLEPSDSIIKSLYESVRNGLFDFGDSYCFPFNKTRLHKYTLFGKILFISVWIIIFGIPFIFSIILSFIVLILIIIFRKACYKD